MKHILEIIDKQLVQVAFIKGNVEYAKAKGQLNELETFYTNVIKIIKEYYAHINIYESDIKSSVLKHNDIFIAHSRGCGYKQFIKKPFFCLDEYEKVPKEWYDEYNSIMKSKGYTNNLQFPVNERPKIHKGHMVLNSDMEMNLRNFLGINHERI